MKFKPLHDRILVKRLEEEETTAGGIYIPDTAREKPSRGEIVAVGSGKVLKNGSTQTPSVKKGEKILFGKYAGTEVTLDGEEHVILREDEILAAFE